MNVSAKGRKHRKLALFMLVILATLMSPMSTTAQPPTPPAPDEFEEAAAVQMLLPDREALNYLVDNGWDLASDVKETAEGVSVTVVGTPSEIAFLQKQGFVKVGTVFDRKAWEALKQERRARLANIFRLRQRAAPPNLQILLPALCPPQFSASLARRPSGWVKCPVIPPTLTASVCMIPARIPAAGT
jgi:hypothetical protein